MTDVAEQLQSEIAAHEQQWLQRLAQDPGQFAQVEQEIHHRFAQLADQASAAVLAQAGQQSALQQHEKKSWRHRLNRFVHGNGAR
jgi:hypothetical protein